MYRNILVPIDGSTHSVFTLNQAVQMAKLLGTSRLTVLNVVQYNIPGANLVPDYEKIVDENSSRLLQKADEQMGNVPFIHDVMSLAGNPAETICRVAVEQSYDLIVIGSLGHGDFSGLLLGSVVHRVLVHSPVPVLVIRPALPTDK